MVKQWFFRAALLLLIPIWGISQSTNWNSVIDLNVTVDNNARIDLYTDTDGNHVIVQKPDQLLYYLFSATGSQIRTSTRDSDVSEDPRLSRIMGYEGKIYIVYKEGDYIKTQKSTNAGANWSTNIEDVELDNSRVNGLELSTDANGLHLVYSEWDDTNSEYNTFYRLVEHDDDEWTDIKQVTDFEGEAGGFPSVTTSANRVHVAYTNSDELSPGSGAGNPVKNRDRLNSTWQDPTTIFSNDASRCFIIATASKLHAFYYELQESPHYFSLEYKNQSFGSTSWSSAAQLQSSSDPEIRHIDMAVTADDQLHIVYYDEKYRMWDGSWSGTFDFQTGVPSVYNQKISANSNDVYVVWYELDSPNYKLKLRQRDFAPLTPGNLTRSIVGPNDNPRVDWNANAEADIDQYVISKKKGTAAWNDNYATTTNTYYVDTAEENVHFIPSHGDVALLYRVKAVDIGSNSSSFSSYVEFNVQEGPWKIAGDNPEILVPQSLRLEENYPNPFNPSTTIRFGLPEEGPVEILVYSMNGQKIATLASGFMEAGFHQVKWNGKDLQGNAVSSGIYIYQLKTGNQRMVKKMVLAK